MEKSYNLNYEVLDSVFNTLSLQLADLLKEALSMFLMQSASEPQVKLLIHYNLLMSSTADNILDINKTNTSIIPLKEIISTDSKFLELREDLDKFIGIVSTVLVNMHELHGLEIKPKFKQYLKLLDPYFAKLIDIKEVYKKHIEKMNIVKRTHMINKLTEEYKYSTEQLMAYKDYDLICLFLQYFPEEEKTLFE
jgi:hypothetical protein